MPCGCKIMLSNYKIIVNSFIYMKERDFTEPASIVEVYFWGVPFYKMIRCMTSGNIYYLHLFDKWPSCEAFTSQSDKIVMCDFFGPTFMLFDMLSFR